MDKKRIVKCVIDENGMLGLTAMGLVDVPAIEENWVALSSEKIKLASVDKERRMLYGAALIPEKLILRIDKNNEEYIHNKTTLLNRIKFHSRLQCTCRSRYPPRGAP